jgi:hypothetical protein
MSRSILEALSLLKVFFTVTRASFISKIRFASPSGCLRAADKCFDTHGSAGIGFSRLRQHFK